MPSLRTVANEYHAHANAVAARAERQERNLTANESKAIAHYRISAEKVEALIRPEDETDTLWMLEGNKARWVGKITDLKVTSADKAATPQELLRKAE